MQPRQGARGIGIPGSAPTPSPRPVAALVRRAPQRLREQNDDSDMYPT
ncbi:hypothetical protein [Streptomyces niveus]